MSSNLARIVVVDDNPATLYSTSRVLRSAGWEVLEARTGEEGLALALQGVDLVVLDINLPDINGFEVCRRLRDLEAPDRTPVVHLSATFVQDADRVHGLEVGADGYLTHPVEPPVLIATVAAFLRTRVIEKELRASEAKFKAVFDNAINGIALIGEYKFLDANSAMCGLLARSCDEIIGKPLTDFVPADARHAVDLMREHLGREGKWRGNLPLQRASGEIVQLEWNVSVHSAPDAWLAVVTDISARVEFEREREELLASERAARSEAERANRLKDDFLATLSHELRTPLNAIVGWSELLKLGQLDPTETREGIEAIERNAKAQAQLIADLLDVSRITSGKLHLDPQPVDPATTVQAALTVVTPAAQAKGIQVATVLDPHAGVVSGDPSRLQQVIWNLVNNAVKFTPRGGHIWVTLRRVDSQVEIAVADDGRGIAADLLPHIFERFRQADAATTRSHGGLGLGLAIVKQLVEMHGGAVRVESPGEGKGATFTVSLPIMSVRSTLEPVATATAPRNQTSLSGIRVMLVDDDADARRLTSRVLIESGAQTQEAGNVADALNYIADFRPHVLVSDLGMPDVDGYDLIREVRTRGYTFHDLPAVALTAFARTEDRRRALLAGFQVHLAKPADPNELTAVIATLVGRTGEAISP